MNNKSWYAAKLSDMDVVRTHDSDDFVVDYDKSRGMYRVTIFQDNHFKDECWFDAYEEKEVNNKIDKVVNTLERHKLNFKEYFSKNKRMCLGSSGLDYYFENLINWIKGL